MTVRELLQDCDSSVQVTVVEESTDLVIYPPDWVGYYLTLDQWVLDEEVKMIYVNNNQLIVEV